MKTPYNAIKPKFRQQKKHATLMEQPEQVFISSKPEQKPVYPLGHEVEVIKTANNPSFKARIVFSKSESRNIAIDHHGFHIAVDAIDEKRVRMVGTRNHLEKRMWGRA